MSEVRQSLDTFIAYIDGEEGAEEALEEILPDLTHFCSYLSDFVLAEVMVGEDEQDAAIHIMEREFITNQLISMVLLYDLSDEVGRRSMDQMVRNLLVSDKVGESLVKGLVEIFSKLHPLSTRINQLAEIISEIREPLCRTVEVPMSEEEERKRKLKVASLKVKINQVREELQKSMLNLDLEQAQLQKNELLELEAQLSQPSQTNSSTEEIIQEPCNDSATLIKCLTIFCNMVECSEVSELTPALQTLHDSLILGCLRSEDPAVRNPGVQALGLLCLLSKDLAKQHITLLMQVSKIDVEKIQITALRCVIDCLHLYGIEEFAEANEDLPETLLVHSPEEEEKEEYVENGGAIIAALCDRLDAESSEIRTLVAEGLCKLLLSSRITSSKLLSRLILMFYNPATGDDSFLRHILGVFFPLYASEDGSNQESLCEAVMPTLQTLVHAPSRSPLASVDIENVTNFLISITSPTILSEESQEKVNAHDTLVFALCSEVLTDPKGWLAKALLRCLNSLHLTPTNFSTLRQLDVLATKIMKVIESKSAQNTVKRFHQKIQGFLSSAPDTETPEDTTATNTEERAEKSIEEELSADRTETTIIRRKRVLYDNLTITDPALFSSEVESEAEGRSPTKRIARRPSTDSLDKNSITFGSPVITSTQIESVQQESQEEPRGSVPHATHISPQVDSEVELTQVEEEVFNSEGQLEKSSQQEHAGAANTKAPSLEDAKSVQERAEMYTLLSSESSGSHMESSSEHTSDEEPTPPKVPHLTRPLRGPSRRGSKSVMAEETASDSSEFSKASRATRKIKSLPDDPLHISSSNSGTDCRSPLVQKPVDKKSSSSRKRSKNSSELLKPSFPSAITSDGSTSDSSVTRTTRSKSKGIASTTTTTSSPSSSNNWCSAVQSLNSSAEDSTSSRVSRTRHSKKSETPETTRKAISLRSSNSKTQVTRSSRRSSRNRSSK